ncbi:MAG: GFA family protein [Gammaproteobacteria bacterium]|nr:GFA family protein [Gammaproteobacteria bacterium]NND59298.1 GFA family protein [Gammaproteobacteria bacterium]
MTNKARGGCLCGTIRFQFELPTLWCAHCHCSLCRRAHGAGVVTWVGVASTGFVITTGEESLTRYRSSTEALRSFCSQCGSTLFFESQKWPGEVHVALANVSTAIDRLPARHVFTENHADWIPLWDITTMKNRVH